MWERAPEVLWRSTSRGPVVVDPQDDLPVVLGGAGALVWELLDRPATAAELLELIRLHVGPDGVPAEDDVSDVLAQLHDRGLVREAS